MKVKGKEHYDLMYQLYRSGYQLVKAVSNTDKPLSIEIDKCRTETTAEQFATFLSYFRPDIRSVFYASRMFREVAPISFQQVKDGQQEIRLTFADGSTFTKIEQLP